MNVGYRPIAGKGVPALERSRLSHVFQNYFRPETIAAANVPLAGRQSRLDTSRRGSVTGTDRLGTRASGYQRPPVPG